MPDLHGSTSGSATAPRPVDDLVTSASHPRSATRVGPSSPWWGVELSDFWSHRELLYFLVWRDVKVRYKQTALGATWAILQPLLSMVVMSVVFGRLAGMPSEGVPYPIFVFAGLLPWTFFAGALTLGANSIVSTPDLVTKVYFPRLIMPSAAVLGGIVDFVLSFLVLIGMMVYYGITPGPRVLMLIPCLLLALVTAFGAAIWFAALNVEYRDVRYALPFLVQIWLFATPVVYPSTLASEPWQTLLGLNPMSGVVEGFRWSLLDTTTTPGPIVLASAAVAVIMLASGALYFRRVEDGFADVI